MPAVGDSCEPGHGLPEINEAINEQLQGRIAHTSVCF